MSQKRGTLLAALLAVMMAVAVTPASAVENGLARTPPMGYNGWYDRGCATNEAHVLAIAETLIRTGMREAGYRHVNLDDCWQGRYRDSAGRLQTDSTRFPHGIPWLARYMHRRGLKLGLYTSTGGETCSFRPASWGHYEVDARTFADWGVDYVKIDFCWMPDGWDPQSLYSRFSAAIRATGARITISVSDWARSVAPWKWAARYGNLWRTVQDAQYYDAQYYGGPADWWRGAMGALDDNAPLYRFARPGAFNDADILKVGLRGLSFRENRTIMGLWSMMAAPLLAGNDLTMMTPATASVLANRRIIAIDQDPLGRQGHRHRANGSEEVWVRQLAGGRRAVMIFNRSRTQRVIVTNLRAVLRSRLRSFRMTDAWSGRRLLSPAVLKAKLQPHASAVYIVDPH